LNVKYIISRKRKEYKHGSKKIEIREKENGIGIEKNPKLWYNKQVFEASIKYSPKGLIKG